MRLAYGKADSLTLGTRPWFVTAEVSTVVEMFTLILSKVSGHSLSVRYMGLSTLFLRSICRLISTSFLSVTIIGSLHSLYLF